jgi:hypothetical protein
MYFCDTVLDFDLLPQVDFGKNGRTISQSSQSAVMIGADILPLHE